MAAINRLGLAAIAAISLLIAPPASAHRMPEVEVTIERTEIDGAAQAAFTVKLHAEDAIRLLGMERQIGTDLADPALLARLGNLAGAKMTLENGALRLIGGETEANSVYLFYVAGEGARLTDARVLSSVYQSWTNRINDKRENAVVTQLFTQGGELKGHRH